MTVVNHVLLIESEIRDGVVLCRIRFASAEPWICSDPGSVVRSFLSVGISSASASAIRAATQLISCINLIGASSG